MIVLVGRSLLAGLVRAVPCGRNVVADVLVRGLTAGAARRRRASGGCSRTRDGADPPARRSQLARGVRGGSPDRLHALAGEDLVEDAGELGVTVADQEPERGDRVAEVHEQATGLLGGPGAVRVGGHAEDVHVPGRDLHSKLP